MGGRLSNANPSAKRQRSAAKRCPEPATKPTPVHKVKPTFSAQSRASVSGALLLRASIDPRGNVTAVAVVTSPDDAVATAAKTAFAQWRFEPATACGKPVASTYAKKWKFGGG